MDSMSSLRVRHPATLALLLVPLTLPAYAQQVPDGATPDPAAAVPASADEQVSTLDQVQVVGQAMTYSKTSVSKEMLDRQFVLGSVNDALNELPGVVVTEADAFGSSDWGTQISMRGFVSNRDTQQIGTTIDGVPNGGSAYGGGSKANRFIDMPDLETVEVSQGTADIASRSNEALGGTLNYLTSEPLETQRVRVIGGIGDNQARKYYARYDTGLIGGNTRAWVSGSSARNDDWIDGSGHTSRDHLAGKFVSVLNQWTLSGYASYDDADESEYASVTPQQFARDPEHDLLTGTLTGIPYLDQNYRSGSRALRKNTFGYVRGAFDGGSGFKTTLTGYAHRMQGRGDWIPPYLVDVSNDGAGMPESEARGGNTVYGGSDLGKLYYLTPAAQLPPCWPAVPAAMRCRPNPIRPAIRPVRCQCNRIDIATTTITAPARWPMWNGGPISAPSTTPCVPVPGWSALSAASPATGTACSTSAPTSASIISRIGCSSRITTRPTSRCITWKT